MSPKIVDEPGIVEIDKEGCGSIHGRSEQAMESKAVWGARTAVACESRRARTAVRQGWA